MGMSISWIGVRGLSREQILDALGLIEAPDLAKRPKAAMWSLPNGWTFVLTADFGYPTPERMAALSADERVMVSVVRGYEHGKAVFAIELNGGELGRRHMSVAGSPPDAWPAIRARLTKEQDEEDRGENLVDCLFDAPLDLAKALCGYRFDEKWPDGQEPVETALAEKKGPGLFGRLLGKH